MAEPTALSDALNDLQNHVAGDLRTDAYNRTLCSTDASIYQVMPYGVLLPKTIEDVHAAVEVADEYGIPLLPRAGGE